jgi:IS5 family transposase
MERQSSEATFMDGLTADLGGPRTEAFLKKVDQAIDLEALAAAIRPDVAPDQPKRGTPVSPVLLRLKGLLWARWFGLSDPQLEEQLRARLSFRRFVGLGLEDATPDETSFVNCRKRLRQTGHGSTLFEGVLSQLRPQRLVLEEGALVDATIVEQATGEKNADGESTRDQCASFTKKHGKTHHGYKAHVNVSKDRFILDYVFDTAKVPDSQHIDRLTEDERRAVYADSAYMNKTRSATLAERGVHDSIVQRRVGGKRIYDPAHKMLNSPTPASGQKRRTTASICSIFRDPRHKRGPEAAQQSGFEGARVGGASF